MAVNTRYVGEAKFIHSSQSCSRFVNRKTIQSYAQTLVSLGGAHRFCACINRRSGIINLKTKASSLGGAGTLRSEAKSNLYARGAESITTSVLTVGGALGSGTKYHLIVESRVVPIQIIKLVNDIWSDIGLDGWT